MRPKILRRAFPLRTARRSRSFDGMHPTRSLAASLGLLVLCWPCMTACGGSTGGPTTPSQPAAIVPAGTYQIVQRTVDNTCGDTGTPPNVQGTVTQTQGSTAFVLRDTGGTTFTGDVQADWTFTANAVFGPDSGGQTYTQRLTGTFTATGFTARLTVDVTPRNCRFTRDWTGTKS
jgi:hypothetical protein